MPVRAVKPVLQFRGNVRAYMTQCEHYCDVLLRYDTAHPSFNVFTVGERAKVQDCLILMSAKLAHRVNV